MNIIQRLNAENESLWTHIGSVAEAMNDHEKALYSYENVLRHNHYNLKALFQIATIYRNKENFEKAIEYYHRALSADQTNTDIWGALGHCYLMMEDLQKAYSAYHQALYNAKVQHKQKQDPHLWYGIGILYERYQSLENAEEAFTSVLKMDSNFEKSNEVYFRLGIIYKQLGKYDSSLECFGYILQNPPAPLTEADIWFQIGHVYELKKDLTAAKKSYERVLKFNPSHSKVLQQLGLLYQQTTSFGDIDTAVQYIKRSIEADPNDGQSWYLLGRCFMAQQKYKLAYDAYQQAVYRDGKNPNFWCSIGVLYFQIGQFRDALDAYSRAIRLNPYVSDVWYDLGTLYESCGQLNDAVDAYQRAAELDSSNKATQHRLHLLRIQMSGGAPAGPVAPNGVILPVQQPPTPSQQPPTPQPIMNSNREPSPMNNNANSSNTTPYPPQFSSNNNNPSVPPPPSQFTRTSKNLMSDVLNRADAYSPATQPANNVFQNEAAPQQTEPLQSVRTLDTEYLKRKDNPTFSQPTGNNQVSPTEEERMAKRQRVEQSDNAETVASPHANNTAPATTSVAPSNTTATTPNSSKNQKDEDEELEDDVVVDDEESDSKK